MGRQSQPDILRRLKEEGETEIEENWLWNSELHGKQQQ